MKDNTYTHERSTYIDTDNDLRNIVECNDICEFRFNVGHRKHLLLKVWVLQI